MLSLKSNQKLEILIIKWSFSIALFDRYLNMKQADFWKTQLKIAIM